MEVATLEHRERRDIPRTRILSNAGLSLLEWRLLWRAACRMTLDTLSYHVVDQVTMGSPFRSIG